MVYGGGDMKLKSFEPDQNYVFDRRLHWESMSAIMTDAELASSNWPHIIDGGKVIIVDEEEGMVHSPQDGPIYYKVVPGWCRRV